MTTPPPRLPDPGVPEAAENRRRPARGGYESSGRNAVDLPPPPSGCAPGASRRNVSTDDFDVIGLRPGDRLVLRARAPITLEDAHRIRAVMDEMLGPQWGVIIGNELDVIVVRREDEIESST